MSTVRQMQPALTPREISEFAAMWYRKLDVHAPMVEVLPFLAEDGLVMKFPETTAKGLADFESWFQRVIRIFFDEVHTVKECTPEITGNEAEVHVVVQWEARYGIPQRPIRRGSNWTRTRHGRCGVPSALVASRSRCITSMVSTTTLARPNCSQEENLMPERTEKGVPDSPLGRLYREHIDLFSRKISKGYSSSTRPTLS